MARIMIGVAWPYANGPIHLGHVAGSLLPPDIFSRFHRLKGNDVLMVSGSDQHGTPITVTAEAEGVDPQEIATRYHDINSKAIEDLGIEFDLFFHTHHPAHTEVVQDLFTTLLEKHHIYEKNMMAPYCPSCTRFLPDRYVEGDCPHCKSDGARGDQCDDCGKPLDAEELVDARCKFCGSEPQMKKTNHFFLRLSAFEEPLKDFISDKDHWRSNTINFTRNWLENGLHDRAITRDMTWGIPIPLPGYDDKRIYVWFDAVTGYLSTSKEWARRKGTPDAWKDFWEDLDCRHYYFLGKDNIPFHTIIWPAMLMGYGGLNLPYDVPANEFLRLKGQQFSKSRGVSIALPDVLRTYDPDLIRYYLTANMPEGRDADFTWEGFVRRCNEELTNSSGNLVHRILTFTKKNYGSIPPPGTPGQDELETEESIRNTFCQVEHYLEGCEFKKAMKTIMELAGVGNRYFVKKQPWAQIKTDREGCATTLHTCLRLIQAMGVMINPFLPGASERLWKMLGNENTIKEAGWEAGLAPLPVGQPLDDPVPLFKVLEIPEEGDDPSKEGLKDSKDSKEESKTNKHTDPNTKKAGSSPALEDDPAGFPLDLRVGTVTSLKDHPNADKLWVLEVDLGTETRTLVAGLKPYYDPEALKGNQIVIVTNLAPAKLRGVESMGMMLAADDGKGVVSFLKPSKAVPNGTTVSPEGQVIDIPDAPLDFKRFLKVQMMVQEEEGKHTILFGENKMIAGVEVAGDGKSPKGVLITLDRPIPSGSSVR